MIIRLRHLAARDGDAYFRFLLDPDIARWLGGCASKDAAFRQLNSLGQEYEQHGRGIYAIADQATDQFLGTCGLREGPIEYAVEVTVGLLPEYRGQGIARRACEEVLRRVGVSIGLPAGWQVVALVNPDNTASTRLLLQLGFCFDRVHADLLRGAEHLYKFPNSV